MIDRLMRSLGIIRVKYGGEWWSKGNVRRTQNQYNSWVDLEELRV